MEFIKEWTFSVCITVIVSVIFCFLAPKGRLSGFYRVIISVLIFLSFIYPFSQFRPDRIKIPDISIESEIADSEQRLVENMLSDTVKTTLTENGVKTSDVTCKSKYSADNEIEVTDVLVAVSDEYDCEEVKEIIFDKLSIRARVIHIGQ